MGFLRLMTIWVCMIPCGPWIIPSIASPAVFYFMYSYLKSSLPLSLVEAARIDGSGEFHTFNRIVLPIMKPAIAVQAIFSFVGSWKQLLRSCFDHPVQGQDDRPHPDCYPPRRRLHEL